MTIQHLSQIWRVKTFLLPLIFGQAIGQYAIFQKNKGYACSTDSYYELKDKVDKLSQCKTYHNRLLNFITFDLQLVQSFKFVLQFQFRGILILMLPLSIERIWFYLFQVSGLWAIVNNAGILCFGSIEEWDSLKDMQNESEVNLWGTVAVTKTFLPLLKKARGRIVNIAGIYGKSPQLVSCPIVFRNLESKHSRIV